MCGKGYVHSANAIQPFSFHVQVTISNPKKRHIVSSILQSQISCDTMRSQRWVQTCRVAAMQAADEHSSYSPRHRKLHADMVCLIAACAAEHPGIRSQLETWSEDGVSALAHCAANMELLGVNYPAATQDVLHTVLQFVVDTSPSHTRCWRQLCQLLKVSCPSERALSTDWVAHMSATRQRFYYAKSRKRDRALLALVPCVQAPPVWERPGGSYVRDPDASRANAGL
jgi:hypothetical protein